MTSTNTGPQPTLTNDIPHEVWLNWRDAYAASVRADDIESILPNLDDRIAKAQAELDFLKSEHKRAGRDITEHRRRAETYREMVELWCTKHGRHLPPELTPADFQLAPPQPPQGALPAGVDPVQNPGDAAEVLGQGAAGETTTQTVIDALGGGDADPLGDFQPRPQHDPKHAPQRGHGNGGSGEDRA